MNIKKWEVAPLDKERAAQLAERYSLPFFLAMLLEIRGVDQEEEIRDLLSGGAALRPFFDEGHGQGRGAYPPGH